MQAPTENPPVSVSHVPPGVVKRLYFWVLHWAETPYGTPALFWLSFAHSSFFPIPSDVLQIALSVSKPKRSFYYAWVNGAGSTIGAILGWVVGYALWATVGWFFLAYVPGVTEDNFAKVQVLYHENAFIALLGAAFTPIPFKVFTIAAGVFDVSLWVLLVAVFIYMFGPGVKALLEKYFEIATLAFFALLVLSFVAIRYLF